METTRLCARDGTSMSLEGSELTNSGGSRRIDGTIIECGQFRRHSATVFLRDVQTPDQDDKHG